MEFSRYFDEFHRIIANVEQAHKLAYNARLSHAGPLP
jgi:hypothetical protein